MERHWQHVMDTFVELADTLTSDYDIGDFLQTLVDRLDELLDVDTAGVMLETPEGELRLAAASSELMKELEDAEVRHLEGPCWDAYRHGEQVVAGDLRDEHVRWPRTAPHALRIGLLAAYAFPLRLRETSIGALNLYRSEPGAFGDQDIAVAQAFADIATIGILQERKVAHGEELARHLQRALDSRVLIEQAKGVVHERHGIDLEDAYRALRREARSSNRKLHDVCRDVVAGGRLSQPPGR